MFALEGCLLPGVAFGKERFVVVRWERGPVGPVSGILRYDPEGRMTVYTAMPAYPDLLKVWHRVHDFKRGEARVAIEGGRLKATATPQDAAPIELDLVLGQTLVTWALNLSLALTLPFVRESEAFVRASGPVAAPLLGVGPGRRFAGRTETGVGLVVASRRIHRIESGRASVGGHDCGALRRIEDPADWGELKMPVRPFLFECRMAVDAPVPDLVRGAAAPSAAGAAAASSSSSSSSSVGAK
jgi:hypothetical protein